MITENYNNFLIYYNNLSTYYVTCVLISVVAILFSWYFHFKNVPGVGTKGELKMEQENETRKIENEQLLREDAKILYEKLDAMMLPSSKEILKKCTEEMTEEQLKIEREVEQQQLSAILELLKNQEDKFQVESMDELKRQLRLYR